MSKENIIQKKPLSVKIIAWIFIVLSALLILSTSIGLIEINYIFSRIVSLTDIARGLERYNFPQFAKTVYIIFFMYINPMFWFFLLTYVFIFISGIQFLRLNEWARRSLEIICWLSLVYLVGISIFIGLTILYSQIAIFNLFTVFIAISPLVIYGPPTIIIIKFLRGDTVRNAMRTKTTEADV